ncbi:acetate--CoA ligase [Rubrivirga sp. S365]|uniref:Acetyl-coenzyme A synthetase n=1 Tax=Rubrivirga litoralis TaxID=3075598 RepID=A0ABU3BPA6_9BACT|nr:MULTISPECIES: acetate--CoA ligase [unclassified Rubrivirga]MDT0631122.1 acetate--CoA ligase [Rubrivirga sp. F394]MDT7855365.1 acetate--CoA ligase [Rubrivirga sp. S365]
MPDERAVYPPAPAVQARAFVPSMADYEATYRRSVEDSDAFWAEQAGRLDWVTPFETVQDWSFEPGDVHIKWYEGGVLNACYNAVDRHVEAGRGGRTAFLFEPDTPGDGDRTITYSDVHAEVQRLANVLRDRGVGRGDRVTIYLPMIPEAAYAMLACARIGAIFSVVFAGFSPSALASRIEDCDSDFVITADEGRRAGRRIALKANVDAALRGCPGVRHVLVVRHTGGDVAWTEGRDVWLDEARETAAAACPCEPMGAEDPLFVLYTSGSTGTPKGVVHTTGGYCVWTSLTHELTFDYHAVEGGAAGDVFWCTADVGWITGHSYIVFGPMINGATQVFFEGTPTYPDAGRFWEVVEKHRVTQFYTAPTAIRALMAKGDEPVMRSDRSSLKVLGTVGEPINPEAWRWYHEVVGEGRCSVVDTWWQTETGGHMLTPLPGATPEKPGSATRPFFGVVPEVLSPDGERLDGEAEGLLVIARSWPGQARTVYRNHDRFVNTYFTAFPGRYFTGDGCRRDADGDYWITGRVDDVLNVSGHRMGTAEVESALVLHEAVAEAAVVGVPHDIKGQGIYVYVTLVEGADATDALRDELRRHVRATIGPIATPDFVQFAPGLPKTRSGKIMRRILRKIGENAPDQLGDTSTLADPDVVASLVQNRRNQPEGDDSPVL